MPSASLAADLLAQIEQRKVLSDPIRFLAAAGVTPDPWQAEVIGSDHRQILLCCSRQAGKSLITAALAMFTALTRPRSKTLVVSVAERQAFELLKAGQDLYRNTGRPVAPLKENSEELRLANGSWIGAVPGKSQTIRGISALDLLAVDEAAFVPDELIMSVLPMLAVKNGQLVALSSPFGKRGWFYEAWKSCEEAQRAGQPEPWQRYSVNAVQCGRLSEEFLERMRRTMGEYWFRQEFMCEFLDATTQLFGTAHIEAALDPSVEQWELPALPEMEYV
jgi:hypothetical protein